MARKVLISLFVGIGLVLLSFFLMEPFAANIIRSDAPDVARTLDSIAIVSLVAATAALLVGTLLSGLVWWIRLLIAPALPMVAWMLYVAPYATTWPDGRLHVPHYFTFSFALGLFFVVVAGAVMFSLFSKKHA